MDTEGTGGSSTVPNINFTEEMLQKLTNIYLQDFIPVLLKHLNVPGFLQDSNVIRSSNLDDLYRYWQNKEHGKMIMCENPGCQYVWFHYDCVGIHCAHRGSWYCPNCVETS